MTALNFADIHDVVSLKLALVAVKRHCRFRNTAVMGQSWLLQTFSVFAVWNWLLKWHCKFRNTRIMWQCWLLQACIISAAWNQQSEWHCKYRYITIMWQCWLIRCLQFQQFETSSQNGTVNLETLRSCDNVGHCRLPWLGQCRTGN